MSCDYWVGVEDRGLTHEDVTLPDIERAISRLDQDSYTLVVLDGHDDSLLMIGGGSGRYVVTFDRGDVHEIARHGSDQTKTLITAGGQEGDFALKNVLPLRRVLEIAHVYFSGTDVHSASDWE